MRAVDEYAHSADAGAAVADLAARVGSVEGSVAHLAKARMNFRSHAMIVGMAVLGAVGMAEKEAGRSSREVGWHNLEHIPAAVALASTCTGMQALQLCWM